MRFTPATAALATACVGVLLGGCGLGGGEPTGGLSLTVTDGFGGRAIGATERQSAPGEETAMRQLQRSRKVETRYDGRYVQAIDGLQGGRDGGRPVDWFYFVNGIEARVGAAETRLFPGDSVWWDRRDWGAAIRVPAVVGQWPDPFRSGIEGKRLAVRVVCPSAAREACDRVTAILEAAGASPAAGIAGVSGRGSGLRVVVGEWTAIRNDPEARSLLSGPGSSGVYAIPRRDGSGVSILDPRGRSALELGGGSGIVAATAAGDSPPTWVIAGFGAGGLERAIGALDGRSLSRKYAAVISPSGEVLGAPVTGGSR